MPRRFFCPQILLWFAALGLFIEPSRLPGQYGTGTILGTVTDPTNAPIPGAKVTARGLETNETRAFLTDAQGNYRFTSLPADQKRWWSFDRSSRRRTWHRWIQHRQPRHIRPTSPPNRFGLYLTDKKLHLCRKEHPLTKYALIKRTGSSPYVSVRYWTS